MQLVTDMAPLFSNLRRNAHAHEKGSCHALIRKTLRCVKRLQLRPAGGILYIPLPHRPHPQHSAPPHSRQPTYRYPLAQTPTPVPGKRAQLIRLKHVIVVTASGTTAPPTHQWSLALASWFPAALPLQRRPTSTRFDESTMTAYALLPVWVRETWTGRTEVRVSVLGDALGHLRAAYTLRAQCGGKWQLPLATSLSSSSSPCWAVTTLDRVPCCPPGHR